MIASKYSLKDYVHGPIEYSAVTLSSNEVSIRASENNEWKVFFLTKAAVNFNFHVSITF